MNHEATTPTIYVNDIDSLWYLRPPFAFLLSTMHHKHINSKTIKQAIKQVSKLNYRQLFSYQFPVHFGEVVSRNIFHSFLQCSATTKFLGGPSDVISKVKIEQ